MGLEGVELVMEVEEAFGIVIADEEAERTRTVGQLFELVVSKLSSSQGCASMVAFNRLRRGLCAVLGTPRRSVLPQTRLDQLLPARRRRAGWRQLSAASGLHLPSLRTPRWVLAVVLVVVVLTAIMDLLGTGVGITDPVVAVLLAGAVLAIVTGRMAGRPPAGCVSVGDLAQAVASRYPSLSASARPDEGQIWSTIVDRTSRVGGVDPARVTRDARFVDDLGF